MNQIAYGWLPQDFTSEFDIVHELIEYLQEEGVYTIVGFAAVKNIDLKDFSALQQCEGALPDVCSIASTIINAKPFKPFSEMVWHKNGCWYREIRCMDESTGEWSIKSFKKL